jgi:uncharacterized protein
MRISSFERQAIRTVFERVSPSDSKIYLFGSRTNDKKKGGDIDLLLVFSSNDIKNSFKRLDFLVEIKKLIGERRIDLTISTSVELASDIFLRNIFEGAVEI